MSNNLQDRKAHAQRSEITTIYQGGRRSTMPAPDSDIAIDLAAAKTDADHALEESPPDATVQVRLNIGASARSAPALPLVAGYEIIEELGRGGMGVVYKAWQHSLKRTVAVKMILGGNFVGERDLDRFRAEALAIARMRHPNLVNIYEIGEHHLLPFYAMEYMEGGNLARAACKGNPSRRAPPPCWFVLWLMQWTMPTKTASCIAI